VEKRGYSGFTTQLQMNLSVYFDYVIDYPERLSTDK